VVNISKYIPLDENGGADGRSRHDLVTHSLVDQWFDEPSDSKIYFMEKDYFYTEENIDRSQTGLIGSPKGDLDFAWYDLEEDELYNAEVKSLTRVPADMTEEARRERFGEIDDAHDQLSTLHEAVEAVETAYDVDIDVNTEVIVWSDIFETKSFNSEAVPNFEGGHYCTNDAYWMAKSSDTFDALNQGMFNGKILERGDHIEEINR